MVGGEARKEKKGKRKKREGGGKQGALPYLPWCCWEIFLQEQDCSSIFQGKTLEFFASKILYYVLGYHSCWFSNLFYGKGWSLCKIKFVCKPSFRIDFYTEMFWSSLELVEFQMEYMIAFWKALNVYFHFPKSHNFLLCGFRVIGSGMKAIHRSSVPRNKFGKFSSGPSSYQNRWLCFLNPFKTLKCVLEFYSGILDQYFRVFECGKVKCAWAWNRGLYF